MPWTNVNRLARNIEEARAVAKELYNQHQAKVHRFHTMAQRNASWNKYMKALQKVRNMVAKLKTMNQGALQVQLAKIENKRKKLDENVNKALEGYGIGKNELIQNVFRDYAHWTTGQPRLDKDLKNLEMAKNQTNWTPQLRALKIKILEDRLKNLPTNGIYNEHFKKIAPIALQYAKVSIDEKALEKAVNLRKRHLASPERAARATIARGLARSIVPRTLYGPYGTRTLEAHRRFNKLAGRQTNYLNKYAEAMREVNRLQRALKRK